MKTFFLSLVLLANLCLPILSALAQTKSATPTQIVKRHFELVQQGKFTAAAQFYSPDDLRGFREGLNAVKKSEDKKKSGNLLKQLFGPEFSYKQLEGLSDREFYGLLIKQLMIRELGSSQPKYEKLEIVGQVRESKDERHILTRTTFAIEGTSLQLLEIVTFKVHKGAWKLQFSANMSRFAKQVKAALKSSE